jgi:MFS family permease
VPYSYKLWTLYLNFWWFGFGSGAWNIALNVWIIEMWKQNSAPFLQLPQFMYGIGIILGPLLDKPYLIGEQVLDSVKTNISNSTELPFNNMTDIFTANDRRSNLKKPFFICGIIQIIGIY